MNTDKNPLPHPTIQRETNLSANSVGRWPQCIIFLGDLTVVNDSLQLFHHTFVDVGLISIKDKVIPTLTTTVTVQR